MSSEILRSSQNPLLKRLKALASDPAARRAEASAVVEGLKLAADAIKSGAKVREAILSEDLELDAEFKKLLNGISQRKIDSKQFKSISSTQSPQGLMLVVAIPEAAPQAKPKLAVAAEGIQDPGNLGTLLRSAWACAADTVLLSRGCADPYSPKVLRAAAGAHWQLNLRYDLDLAEDLKSLRQQGLQVLGLDVRAKNSLWDCKFSGAICLVVGAEGQGLSEDCLAACGSSIKIEYPGSAESLNAGVSLSVALFEVLRQSSKK